MNTFYGILLVVQLALLIWCCIRSTKRNWIFQLSLQGFCTALAIALYIYYEYFTPVTQPGPLGAPYLHETWCSIIAAVFYAALLLIGALAAAIRWPRNNE